MKRFTATKNNHPIILDHEQKIGYTLSEHSVEDVCNLLNSLHEQSTAQAETIAKLREALELIADDKSWVNMNGEVLWNDFYGNEFHTQHAKDIARTVLSETEGK